MIIALFVSLVSCRLTVIALRRLDGILGHVLLPVSVLRDSACVAIAIGLGVSQLSATAAWVLHVAWVAVAVINVPVSRVLGSPSTDMMMRASGGAISDSLREYVSWSNVIGLSAVTAAVVATPFVVPRGFDLQAGVVLMIVAILSHLTVRRIPTRGVHRDPLLTLLRTRAMRSKPRRIEPSGLVAAETRVDLASQRGAAAQRHVVWISLESTGVRGLHDAVMPHVKGLSGWTFENAYAVCPESIKGLASWLCSFCPTPHTWPGQYRASAFEATSLATVLKSAGYSTALFHAGRFDYLGMAEVLEARGFDVLRDASAIEAKDVRPFGVDEDSVVDAALAHLDGATHPAFVAYLPIAGHHPYLAPGASNGGERDERARYLLDLAHGDRAIGRLFDGIRARGLWERTLFVVHGDHGEAFGEHEGNRVHTFQVYEENVRVPLFIVAPGSTLTPRRIESLVALTDLAPTVLDLLGLPAPADWEGQSALSPRARVIRMFADYGVEQLALRDGPYKFVWSPETGRPELYDVSCDPNEHVNLADAHRERVARYLADLRRLRDRSARGEVR